MFILDFYRLYYGQLKWGYIYITTNMIIGMTAPVLFCSYSWKNKKSMAALIFHMLAGWFLMDAVGMVLEHFYGSAFLEPFVGCLVVPAIFACFTHKFSLKSKVAAWAAYAALCTLTITLTQCIGSIRVEEDFVLQRFLITLNFCLIFIPSLMYRQFAPNWMPNWFFAGFYSLLSLVCYFLTFLSSAYRIPDYIMVPCSFILLIFLIAMGYGMYYMGNWMSQRNRQQAEKIMRQADDNMLQVLTDMLDKEHRIRHDLRNHMLVMQTLLEQKEYDKLQNYFAEYSGQLVPVFMGFRCPNRAISAIVSMEAAKAAHRNIRLEPSIAVPQEMGFVDADLSSLLMNLVDNAIEYVEKTSDLLEKAVYLQIRLIRRTLLITVRNPILEVDTAGALSRKTTKKDKEIHGYGTKIVASIARAYNGAVAFETKDGYFEASVTLTEPEKETRNE